MRRAVCPCVFYFSGRCFHIGTQREQQQINDAIRDREVRVVSETGEQLGIMSSLQALRMAESRNLDLVKIAPQARPPVVKIMDYGKFRFEQSRREKEARKNQRVVELKEIRLSVGIDKHDFDTKARQARQFLEQGHKVKVSIRFRGREMAHANLANDNMKEFAESCAEVSTVERVPKLEGRQMLMFLTPKAKPQP
ncbi:MAG: translation initiation factor IF-3 [Oscillospiraceae bacterium]|jgi:translation initiation factor IF-3|nr:translation initiation factor IF-3 [Oscillospiraceae bacterium]